MIVEIDGNRVECGVVKVIWPEVDERNEIHVTLSHEGVVFDVLKCSNVDKTAWYDLDQVAEFTEH